jgi:hypothetical protein
MHQPLDSTDNLDIHISIRRDEDNKLYTAAKIVKPEGYADFGDNSLSITATGLAAVIKNFYEVVKQSLATEEEKDKFDQEFIEATQNLSQVDGYHFDPNADPGAILDETVSTKRLSYMEAAAAEERSLIKVLKKNKKTDELKAAKERLEAIEKLIQEEKEKS